MKLKRSPLTFHHVLSTTRKCKTNEWHLIAKELRNAVILNGLYATGPVIYQVANFSKEANEAEYTFYMPVNAPVDMPENDKFAYQEVFEIKDGLVFRHADLDEDIEVSYDAIKLAADANQFKLQEPFYNIYLDVYGGGIIDIYAPIVGED